MISLKYNGIRGTDAKVKGMQPEILLAIIITEQLMRRMYERDLTLTSITDGHKDKPKSLHNSGYAFDMRTWSMNEVEETKFAKELSQLLGEEYDVVVEESHIHVEFDPKEVESELKHKPEVITEVVLTQKENQKLLGEVYEGSEVVFNPKKLERKIDKILEWIKFHGEDMKCKGGECKFDELEHPCRLTDEHVCSAETTL